MVDDLLAITIIAVFYTTEVHLAWLAAAVVPIVVFAVLVQRRIWSAWLLLPLAAVAWTCVHASGVHATVAGVVPRSRCPCSAPTASRSGPRRAPRAPRPSGLGRFRCTRSRSSPPGSPSAAGTVSVSSLQDPVSGIVTGLVVGKTVGVAGSTWLLAWFTRAELDGELSWVDVVRHGDARRDGFTVSLLIGELAFGNGSADDDHVKVAVLVGSLVAALLATAVLRARNRVYRRLCELEERDSDADGIPTSTRTGPQRPRPGRAGAGAARRPP